MILHPFKGPGSKHSMCFITPRWLLLRCLSKLSFPSIALSLALPVFPLYRRIDWPGRLPTRRISGEKDEARRHFLFISIVLDRPASPYFIGRGVPRFFAAAGNLYIEVITSLSRAYPFHLPSVDLSPDPGLLPEIDSDVSPPGSLLKLHSSSGLPLVCFPLPLSLFTLLLASRNRLVD